MNLGKDGRSTSFFSRATMTEDPSNKKGPTPVDDVRRVRERLTREAGGDIAKLAEQANRVAEQLRKKLGLKKVEPPGPADRRDSAARTN